MSGKKADPEEFMSMVIDLHKAFKEVMKTGSPMEKKLAIQGFQSIQRMIKEHVEEFSARNKISAREMEEIFCKSNPRFKEAYIDTKERLVELKKEIGSLVPEPETKDEKLAIKRKQRRRMEKKLRAKS